VYRGSRLSAKPGLRRPPAFAIGTARW